MDNKLTTGQYYTDRVLQGPRWLEAAEDFVDLAGRQADKVFSVLPDGDGMGCTIDLEEWPDDDEFGAWFNEWIQRWDITVQD